MVPFKALPRQNGEDGAAGGVIRYYTCTLVHYMLHVYKPTHTTICVVKLVWVFHLVHSASWARQAEVRVIHRPASVAHVSRSGHEVGVYPSVIYMYLTKCLNIWAIRLKKLTFVKVFRAVMSRAHQHLKKPKHFHVLHQGKYI